MKPITAHTGAKAHCETCANPPHSRVWGGRIPNPSLLLAALACSLVVGLPVLYLGVRAGQGGWETWEWLLSRRLPELLSRTFRLAAGATLLATAISLPMAWLVTRTDLPGRRWITWLAALPLVFPPYIGAFAYITVFGPRSLMEKLLSAITGIPGRELWRPEIYSVSGAVLILAVFTYPYIYLLVASAFRGANQSLEEAARVVGLTPTAVFWRVTVPMVRPALAAGAMLVALYAMSDFGSVAMLRVETFTSAIYMQLRGRFDRSAAAALSMVLVLITMLLLWAEERIQKQGARYTQTTSQWKPIRPVELGAWKLPAAFFAWFVVMAGVGMPGGMLAYWTYQGVVDGEFSAKILKFALNSIASSAGAATLATILAFPLAYFAARYTGPVSRALYRFAYTGYAMPGLVVALAVIFFFHRFLGPLYGTTVALVAAYLIRFLPQSMGAARAGLEALAPSLEDAGRSLGFTPLQVLSRITLPLIAPSIVTGWCLVFLNTLKELPATLLLRPAGFDTLAVRVWIEADEGYYAQAAPAALLLVLIAAVPMCLLLRRIFSGKAQLT